MRPISRGRRRSSFDLLINIISYLTGDVMATVDPAVCLVFVLNRLKQIEVKDSPEVVAAPCAAAVGVRVGTSFTLLGAAAARALSFIEASATATYH